MRFSLRSVFLFFIVASLLGAVALWTGFACAPVVALAAGAVAAAGVRLSRTHRHLANAGLFAVVAAIFVTGLVSTMFERLAVVFAQPVPPWQSAGRVPETWYERPDPRPLLVLAVFAALVVWLVGVVLKRLPRQPVARGAENEHLWIGFAALAVSIGFAAIGQWNYWPTRELVDPLLDPRLLFICLLPGVLIGAPYLIAWHVVRSRSGSDDRTINTEGN